MSHVDYVHCPPSGFVSPSEFMEPCDCRTPQCSGWKQHIDPATLTKLMKLVADLKNLKDL